MQRTSRDRKRSRMGYCLAVLCCAGVALWAFVREASALEPHDWTTYKNARYGFSVEYPADMFLAQPAPTNNAGRAFLSTDGKAGFSVSGSWNALEQSLSEYKKWLLEDVGGYGAITYQSEGWGWFVLSGLRGDRVYYEKVIFSCQDQIVNTLSAHYPVRLKPVYDNIVVRLQKSFRPGAAADNSDCR